MYGTEWKLQICKSYNKAEKINKFQLCNYIQFLTP